MRKLSQYLRRSRENFYDDTITNIAACKDRANASEASLPSWRKVKGFTEIALVDYETQRATGTYPLAKGLATAGGVSELFIRMTNRDAAW